MTEAVGILLLYKCQRHRLGETKFRSFSPLMLLKEEKQIWRVNVQTSLLAMHKWHSMFFPLKEKHTKSPYHTTLRAGVFFETGDIRAVADAVFAGAQMRELRSQRCEGAQLPRGARLRFTLHFHFCSTP